MRFVPHDVEIAEDGFDNENDPFQRRDFAERLTNLVKEAKGPLVAVLDAPWGAGKTVFAKQWAAMLRHRGARVVYFDAFEGDHHEDAFIPLAAEIEHALAEGHTAAVAFRKTAARAFRVIAPKAADVTLKFLMRGALDLADVQGITRAISEDAGEAAGGLAAEYFEQRLASAADEKAAIENFRAGLAKLAGRGGDGASFPLVVMIDELDRCRPDFAIRVLERVKHFFSVENVVFILIVNLDQLEQAVKGVYGSSIAARTYIEKFYHLRLRLPKPPPPSQRTHPLQDHVVRLWEQFDIPNRAHRNQHIDMLVNMAPQLGLELRTIERILVNYGLYMITADDRHIQEPSIIFGICTMRHLDPPLYERAASGRITLAEVDAFFAWAGQDTPNWARDVWSWAVGPEEIARRIETSSERISSAFAFMDRGKVVPHLCSILESLHPPKTA